jgi:hypothetical protein
MLQSESLAGCFRSDEQKVIQDSPLGFTDAQAIYKGSSLPSGEAISEKRRSFRALLGMPGRAREQPHRPDIGQLRCNSTPDLRVRRIASGQENFLR